jgi:hypothetical protein
MSSSPVSVRACYQTTRKKHFVKMYDPDGVKDLYQTTRI